MKTEHEIEESLRNAKKVALQPEAKEGIRSQLLARARRSYDTTQPHRTISVWDSLLFKTSFAFAVCTLVLTSTVQAAQHSAPGEPLYAFKVTVVEDLIELAKFTPEDKAEYQLELMELRFDELQELAHQSPTDETLALVALQIDEHIKEATHLMGQEDAFTHAQKLQILQKLATLAKAQTQVAKEETSLGNIADEIEHTHDSAASALADEVEDFTTNSPAEAVTDYLSEEIKQTGDILLTEETDTSVRENVIKHLHDTNESLIEGDAENALNSLFLARQAINLDTLLSESEEDAFVTE